MTFALFVGLAVKSLLVAGVTFLLLRLFAERSAAERGAIAHGGLIVLLLLPLIALLAPQWTLESALMGSENAVPLATPSEPSAIATPDSAATPVVPFEAVGPAPTISTGFWLYALPALALLIATFVATVRLSFLKARSQVVRDPSWLAALAHTNHRYGFKHGTALLVNEGLTSPISWGLARPVILLDERALEESNKAEAIIAHELAHIAHGDWIKLILARLAVALFWFNPAVWLLAREAHQLREEAADDRVLGDRIDAPGYAELLVGVARHDCRAVLVGAHGVAPGKNSLKRRVRRILDSQASRSPASPLKSMVLMGTLLLASAPLAALTLVPVSELIVSTTIAQVPAAEPIATADVTATTISAAAQEVDASTDRSKLRYTVSDAARQQLREQTAARFAVDDSYWRSMRTVLHDLDGDDMDMLVDLYLSGADQAYVRAMQSEGVRFGNAGEVIATKTNAVDRTYIRVLQPYSIDVTNAGELIALRTNGVTSDYLRSMTAAGLEAASGGEWIALASNGVDAGYIEMLKRFDVRNVGAGTLIALHSKGVDEIYLGAMTNAGIGPTSAGQWIAMKSTGVDADFVRRYPGLSGEQLIAIKSVTS